ncbi:hypothetical protein J4429_00710 [Candidatus Pacearchaeota archaeon]|nr:hypothetical protein [Candidatus Pacearchaeota archaeon]
MGKTNILEQRAFYEDKEKGIRFVQNLIEHGAYDVFVGEDHFYIPDRVVPDLGSKSFSTRRVIMGLEAMNPQIKYILETNNINPEAFHIALLKVRNLELEAEIANILSQGLHL